jgi:hypothetical protein
MTLRLQLLATLLIAGLIGLSGCSRKTAEEKGAAMAQEKVDLAKGIGGVLEQQGAAAGESIVHGAGETLAGMAKGFEKSFGRTISSSPALAQAGITISKVQDTRASGEKAVHGIDIYVVADKSVSGTLRVVVLDKAKNEIARTGIPVTYAAGDGRYETIALDERVELHSISTLKVDFAAGGSAAAAGQ